MEVNLAMNAQNMSSPKWKTEKEAKINQNPFRKIIYLT